MIQPARDQVFAGHDAVPRAAPNYNGGVINVTIFIQPIQSYIDAINSYKDIVTNRAIALDLLCRYSSRLLPTALQALTAVKVSMKASP